MARPKFHFFVCLGSINTNFVCFDERIPAPMYWNANSPEEHPLIFEERFWRCRDSLWRVACLTLGNTKAASQVVENCFLTASRDVPRLASEVAFGCWLLRILINEALLVRSQMRSKSGACPEKKVLAKLFDSAKVVGVCSVDS